MLSWKMRVSFITLEPSRHLFLSKYLKDHSDRTKDFFPTFLSLHVEQFSVDIIISWKILFISETVRVSLILSLVVVSTLVSLLYHHSCIFLCFLNNSSSVSWTERLSKHSCKVSSAKGMKMWRRSETLLTWITSWLDDGIRMNAFVTEPEMSLNDYSF